MVRHIRRVVTLVVGSALVLFGVICGPIPICQGWIFVLAGLMVLAKEVPIVRYYLQRLKRRFPKQAEALHRLRDRIFPGRGASARAVKKPNATPR
ncbi:MAG: PGPGW domain-containing protein [Nitrospirota bacterium]